MNRDICKTPPFDQSLRQAQISFLEILNIFLWLQLSPSLILPKIEHFSKVSKCERALFCTIFSTLLTEEERQSKSWQSLSMPNCGPANWIRALFPTIIFVILSPRVWRHIRISPLAQVFKDSSALVGICPFSRDIDIPGRSSADRSLPWPIRRSQAIRSFTALRRRDSSMTREILWYGRFRDGSGRFCVWSCFYTALHMNGR